MANLQGSPLNPRLTLESFIIAGNNELAFRAAQRIVGKADGYNPLFVYGGVGLGKTHLLQGTTRTLLASGRKAVYLTPDALRHRPLNPSDFANALDEVEVLLVDDFELFEGIPVADRFYSCILFYINSGGALVIAAQAPPVELSGLTRDVSSRLGMGLVTEIRSMETSLRREILERRVAELAEEHSGFHLDDHALTYLSSRRVDGRALEGIANRLCAEYALRPREFSLTELKEIVQRLLPQEAKVTIDEIQRRVVEFYALRLADMTSARRARVVARPRQVAMYLTKKLTGQSLPQIGRRFGGRDHTTVMHACKKIEELLGRDRALQEDIDTLRRWLER